MCKLLLLVLLLAALSQGSEGSEAWPGGRVYELSPSALREGSERFEHFLVDFYAPRCGHCQALAEELDVAAPSLVGQVPPVAIGKIDIQKYPEIAAHFKIDKIPTLKLFSHGEPVDYNGPREASSMVPYLQRQLAPDVMVLPTESSISEYLKVHAGGALGVFLGFGLTATELQLHAKKHKTHAWFAVYPHVTEELMYTYDFDKGPALLSVHGAGEQEIFYGPFDEGSDLADFIQLNYIPPIVILNEMTYSRVTTSGRPIVLIISDFDGQAPISLAFDSPEQNKVDSHAGDAVRYVRRCKPVARRHRKYLFTYVDASKYGSFLASFGISKGTALPTVLVWNGGTQFYEYEHEKEFRGDDMEFALAHFLEDIDSGKLIAKETQQSLVARIWNVFQHPNFSLAVIALIVAVAIKLGKKGGKVLLPEMQPRKDRRRNHSEQSRHAGGGGGGGEGEGGDSKTEEGEEGEEGEGESGEGAGSEEKKEEQKKND